MAVISGERDNRTIFQRIADADAAEPDFDISVVLANDSETVRALAMAALSGQGVDVEGSASLIDWAVNAAEPSVIAAIDEWCAKFSGPRPGRPPRDLAELLTSAAAYRIAQQEGVSGIGKARIRAAAMLGEPVTKTKIEKDVRAFIRMNAATARDLPRASKGAVTEDQVHFMFANLLYERCEQIRKMQADIERERLQTAERRRKSRHAPACFGV